MSRRGGAAKPRSRERDVSRRAAMRRVRDNALIKGTYSDTGSTLRLQKNGRWTRNSTLLTKALNTTIAKLTAAAVQGSRPLCGSKSGQSESAHYADHCSQDRGPCHSVTEPEGAC